MPGADSRDPLLLMLDRTAALRPSELHWRSFDNRNPLSTTETVCRRKLRPFGKTARSLTKVQLPDGLASELRPWTVECKGTPPEAFIFPNEYGGLLDAANYRFRVLKPLAEMLGIEKLNFQILRPTMAIQAQNLGSVKDIQAHLRHSSADTTANESMRALPESVQEIVGSVSLMLAKGKEEKMTITDLPQIAPKSSGE